MIQVYAYNSDGLLIISCVVLVSVFKLGRIFALFPRLTQYLLAKAKSVAVVYRLRACIVCRTFPKLLIQPVA